MSRIGKKPIEIPAGIKVTLNESLMSVEGPKGKLTQNIHVKSLVEINDNVITVTNTDNSKLSRSLHGLTRTLIYNMIVGVISGYEKKLEIVGVGYRANLKGKKLDLALGFSHPVSIEPPVGIEFVLDGQTKITVKGIDKQLVGQVAADIRKLRKPEPYKGKGIRYANEYILRKAGKAGK